MKKVYVEWLDSYIPFPPGWQDLEDIEEEIEEHTFICKSIGFLYSSSESFITIFQNLDGEDEKASGILKIPKVAITKMEELTSGKQIKNKEK